ncbi:hypothetical protein G6F55_014256 [Rhizopus delemar]|nr:hypothetical protein G6F55_014256 [Rhizopus delemar]
MNKPSKFALALAFAAVTASGVASAQTVDNWRNPFGNVWKNGANELCWRDAFWTPATGIPGCDGVPVAQQKAKPAPMAAKVVSSAAGSSRPASSRYRAGNHHCCWPHRLHRY